MPNLHLNDLSDSDEKGMLERIAASDLDAFWSLWRCHHDYLRRVALRLCHGDRHEAEDILGDTCLRLAGSMSRHAANVGDSRRWLARVVINTGIDRMRLRSRGSIGVGSSGDLATLLDAAGAADCYTPERLVTTREQMRKILQIFAALPERLRTIARMHFLYECSYAYIAEELGISAALARKRIQEVRIILKQSLNDSEAAPRRRPATRAKLEQLGMN